MKIHFASDFYFDETSGLILMAGETAKDWETWQESDPVTLLQLSLHNLLVDFINATDLRPASAILPQRFACIGRQRHLEIAYNAAELLGNGGDYLSRVATQRWSGAMSIAQAIAEGYRLLATILPMKPSSSIQRVKSTLDRKSWLSALQRDELQPLKKLFHSVQLLGLSELAGFWIHGSLATLDYVWGYSDCDATVIIREDSCMAPKTLIYLRNILSRLSSLLHKIDALQHHGLFVITEVDLRSYQQVFFPLGIIERSIELLYGTNEIAYYDSGRGFASERDMFLTMAQRMRAVAYGRVRLHSAYAIKAHLQTAVLMPVIYLQLRDERFWHKRDALAAVHKEVPQRAWAIIENATWIRQKWGCPLRMPFSFLDFLAIWNARLPSVCQRAISFFSTHDLRRQLINGWEHACLSLSEHLLASLRDRNCL